MLEPVNDSALREACKGGQVSEVMSLLEQIKADNSARNLDDTYLQSGLASAVAAGHHNIVDCLLNQGARFRPSLVTLAMGARPSVEMFDTFLRHGWDINSDTDMGWPALKHCVHNKPLLKWFLDHGADPEKTGSRGINMCDVAAACASPACFDLLVAHGAKVEDSDALVAAAGELEQQPERVEMLAHLLEKYGIDINAIERSEQSRGRGMGRGTALHAAVYAQEPVRIVFLLNKGAEPSIRNTLGQTALEFAIHHELDLSIDALKKHLGT